MEGTEYQHRESNRELAGAKRATATPIHQSVGSQIYHRAHAGRLSAFDGCDYHVLGPVCNPADSVRDSRA